MIKRSFLVFVGCLLASAAIGQILDDSTKLVYGPNTLTFYKLDDQKDNIDNPGVLDTTLTGLGNFTMWDKMGKQAQDLGANGTAIKSMFYESPGMIGLRSGYDAYSPFVKQQADVRFFDTKSPFLDLFVAFGGVGRSLVDFDFSRNIKPNINFGFGIDRLTTDKQIGPVSSEGDRNAVATNLDLNGFYRSKDDRYLAMFYAYRFLNTVNETGGVQLDEDDEETEIFTYEDAPIQLRNVEATDTRTRLHFYHEYKLSDALQLYHEVDHSRQRVNYIDELDAAIVSGTFNQYADVYPNFFLDSAATSEAHSFRSFSNEVGIKGDIEKGFYRAYLKRRDALGVFRYTDDQRAGEVYVGGVLRYDLNEKNAIGGKVEFLQTGDFNVFGKVDNNFFEASYNIMQYQPSLIEQRYFGNHYFWENDFQSVLKNEIKGGLKLDVKGISVKPNVSLTTLSNYVYFNTEARPEQANENILLNGYGLDLGFRKYTSKAKGEFFGVDAEAKYTLIGGGDAEAFQAPELFVLGKVFWEGFLFNNSLQTQVGADLMYRSAYFAYDYAPASQQFFLQNQQRVTDYFLADLFINFKVEKIRIFFKFNHFNQRNNEGFQITPLYPVQQRVLDLGVHWFFFD
ncbi:MAG: putative porin [Bacteroidota bacterium]